MAFNKNSNGYTFLFAIVMVVLVGAILASLSLSLKPMQKANEAEKKMMNILGAIGVPSRLCTRRTLTQPRRAWTQVGS